MNMKVRMLAHHHPVIVGRLLILWDCFDGDSAVCCVLFSLSLPRLGTL